MRLPARPPATSAPLWSKSWDGAAGYLALMSAMATGADWALIPESPPDVDNWEEQDVRGAARRAAMGRRDSIVIVAEGAQDRNGNQITADYVRQVLEERLGEDVRITILGHVQRGGSPSAYDRIMSTLMGVAAVDEVLTAGPDTSRCLIGMKGNQIVTRAADGMCRQDAARSTRRLQSLRL